MKPHTLIWALVLIITVTLVAIVGLNAVVEGDTQPILLIVVGLITPIVTTILNLIKSDKTLDVSKSTDKKVDSLLNGGLTSRIEGLEVRMGHIESSLVEILAKVSK